jgi:hypothetical protein
VRGRRTAAQLLAVAAIIAALTTGFMHSVSWSVAGIIAAIGLCAGVVGFVSPSPAAGSRSGSRAGSRAGKKKKKKKEKGKRSEGEASDRFAIDAIRNAIKTGLVGFNIPSSMTQGRKEVIFVSVARSTDLRDTLASELHDTGDAQFEEIQTSLYMEVKLSGPTFDITSHSPAEQLIIPEPARWEFDVLPCRAGPRRITVLIAMRIEAQGITGGRRSVSFIERIIDVRVNYGYTTRRFAAANWQWMVPAILALAGTVAAWLVVPF